MPPVNDIERIAMVGEIAQQIAAGNFAARVKISDKMDEIDALGASINMLAEELGSREEQIKVQIIELKKFNSMFIDRELKMTELKEEVAQLKQEVAGLKEMIKKQIG
jgi:predicted  nucleic acid-binding Zn-ribbon protein